jgi:hypothetical protein
MTYNSTTPEDMVIRLPIASQAIAFADRFSQQQPTPAKRAQVSLNTLAVCAIDDYLKMMGFETNLTAGDSWNPIARMCADVADLQVTNIGKLECRPVNPGDLEYSIPPEVWLDRVGYMFVQIDPVARSATILGFIPQARASVRLAQLRSLEDFIDHLHSLMTTPIVQLHRWLEGIDSAIETGWQTIESLFATPELAFRSANSSIANSIQRGKVINLGIQLHGHSIALIVELSPVADAERTQVRLRVESTNHSYLLPNIQLIVIDESNQPFLEAQSRSNDNILQLQFTGNPGEKFGAIVKLGAAEVSEQFII